MSVKKLCIVKDASIVGKIFGIRAEVVVLLCIYSVGHISEVTLCSDQ